MKTIIVMPVYNEELRAIKTIKHALSCTNNPIVVVNDGSTDSSWSLLQKYFRKNRRIILVNHITNLGKGAAMKTGAEMAWQLKPDAIIFMDCDGQHNPKHLPLFEQKLKSNVIVFGVRKLSSRMPLIRRWGNIFATNLIEIIFGIKKKDLLSGFVGIRKEAYNKVIWNSSRYEVETEMATRVAKLKIPFGEVQIDTTYIDKYKGVTIIDALKILFQIPVWYFEK
jgi:glycosyltransferase involved in cell wall biosynthesis